MVKIYYVSFCKDVYFTFLQKKYVCLYINKVYRMVRYLLVSNLFYRFESVFFLRNKNRGFSDAIERKADYFSVSILFVEKQNFSTFAIELWKK